MFCKFVVSIRMNLILKQFDFNKIERIIMQKEFQSFIGEEWKNVDLKSPYVKDYRLEVSNFGRLRSVTPKGLNLLKGSDTNGYRTIRLKLFKPRPEEDQLLLDKYLKEIRDLRKVVRKLEKEGPVSEFNSTQGELEKLIKKKDKFLKKETKARTIYYQALVHRLVAEYFLPETHTEGKVVAHLDFNKHNNRPSNLKWMTMEENIAHQQNSPYVISDYKKRKDRFFPSENNSKLTETKVMYLKKLLNEGKPMKQLVRMFKVTETQILRINRGENWGRVKAAK